MSAAFLALVVEVAPATEPEAELKQVIRQYIEPIVPADGGGGVAVALRLDGRALFLNYGWAERASKRPITSDSLFNLASLRKVFEVTVLAESVKRGDLKFDDPVAKYVVELQQGYDIRGVTLGQLATHTSGLLLPSDHPPWPERHYTLAEFIAALKAWKADAGVAPGKQHIYTHAGFVLLQLALERRFGKPIEELIARSVLEPLGMTSTVLPPVGANGRVEPAPELQRRAVQGYSEHGEPIGIPGDQQGYFDFPGTGQMFSSARDLATLLTAHLGELPIDRTLQEAMRLTQQEVFRISPRNTQALAWEVNKYGGPAIIDKPGGLNNSSTYIGMVPSRRLAIVILSNRGFQHPYEIGRKLLPALAMRAQ